MKILKAALMGAGIFALICFGLAFVRIGKLAADLSTSAQATIQAVKDIDVKASSALTDARRLIVIAGGAATEAQKASADQRKFLKNADWLVGQDLSDLHEVLQQARSTILDVGEQTNAVGNSATATINQMQPILWNFDNTSLAVSKLAESPDIPATLASVRDTATHVDGAAIAIEGTMQDVHKVTHHYEVELDAKTPWYRRVWHIVLGLGELSYYATNIR